MRPAVCKSIKKFCSVLGNFAPQQIKDKKSECKECFQGNKQKKSTPNQTNQIYFMKYDLVKTINLHKIRKRQNVV